MNVDVDVDVFKNWTNGSSNNTSTRTLIRIHEGEKKKSKATIEKRTFSETSFQFFKSATNMWLFITLFQVIEGKKKGVEEQRHVVLLCLLIIASLYHFY